MGGKWDSLEVGPVVTREANAKKELYINAPTHSYHYNERLLMSDRLEK